MDFDGFSHIMMLWLCWIYIIEPKIDYDIGWIWESDLSL